MSHPSPEAKPSNPSNPRVFFDVDIGEERGERSLSLKGPEEEGLPGFGGLAGCDSGRGLLSGTEAWLPGFRLEQDRHSA